MANYRLPSINKVFLVGRATDDTVLRFSGNGNPFCIFTLACNRRFMDRATGEWKDSTAYITVQLLGRAAERLCDRIKKGTPLYIEGRLHTYKKEVGGVNVTHTLVSAFTAQILQSIGAEEEMIPESEGEPVEDVPSVSQPVEDELPPIAPEEEELPFA